MAVRNNAHVWSDGDTFPQSSALYCSGVTVQGWMWTACLLQWQYVRDSLQINALSRFLGSCKAEGRRLPASVYRVWVVDVLMKNADIKASSQIQPLRVSTSIGPL